MRLFKGLNLRVAVPELAVDLVPTDVEVGLWKKLGHLLDELIHELVGLFASRVCHRRRAILVLHGERAVAARQFGIAYKPRAAVPWRIKFRNDADTAIMRIGDEVANLFLRVVVALGSHAGQFRKYLAL